MPDTNKATRLEMGGQAVLEGVLMRTRHGYSVAVRRASGAVVIQSVPFRPLNLKHPWLKTPFLRGAVMLFEMLAIGIRALQFSAEEMEKDAPPAEKSPKDGESKSAAPRAPAAEQTPPAEAIPPAPLPQDAASVWTNWAMVGMIVFSFGIALVLMVVVPNLLAEGVGRLANSISDAPAASNPFAEEKRPLLYNLVSGGFRAVILFGYIGFISRIREIRRVFQYHGAEHKAVFAFETGGPLTTERAQTFSTHHPRCGTSFLVVVVAVSIVVFAFVAWAYVAAWPGFASLPFVVKKVLILLGHIVALPVVAGVSYEFLKLSARWSERGGVWRWLVWPGLQTQRLTTRPPDDRQVEVALLALKAALAIQPGATERQVELIPPASAPTQAPLVESAPTGV